MSFEITGQIPFFLQSFLSKPATALPKGAQWVLVFEGAFNNQGEKDYDSILPVQAIQIGVSYEPRKWDIDKAINITLDIDNQLTKGCMFVQAVKLPGEANTVNPEGLQQSGYIRTTSGGGRDAFENLEISFLDTNISFVDNVIRPWVIATSHLGMIARKGRENYRCNISVYKIGVLSIDQPPFILQRYTFFGACPISVSGEEYNYTQTGTAINREATFIYHYYSLDSTTNNLIVQKRPGILPLPIATASNRVNETLIR
jgi:hypothetical protein